MVKFIKFILYFIFSIVILLFGLIAFAPTIFSTDFFRTKIIKFVNHRINGTIEVKELSFSWFDKQSATNLVIKDSNRNTILNIDSVSISEPLFKLIFNGISSNQIEIKNLGLFLLGKKSNFNALYDQKKGILEIQGMGENLKIPKTILILKNGINLQTPLEIECTLDSKFLNDLYEDSLVKFNNSVKLKVDVKNFLYTLNPQEKNDIDIKITSLNDIELFFPEDQEILTLNSGKFFIFSNSINFLQTHFQTNLQPPRSSSHFFFDALENSNLKIIADVDIKNRLQPTIIKTIGELKGKNISANIALKAEENLLELSSPAFINTILTQEYLNESSFKKNFSSIISRTNGSISAQIIGKYGNASLDGSLKNGIFTLNTPFIGELKVTPELTKEVFKKFFPILSDLEDAEQPFIVKIEPKDFKILIPEFKINNIQTGLCSIDFGKMRFKNKGQMKLIFAFLEKQTKDFISVWMTPLYFQINEGKMTIQRVDMLFNNAYPAAAWGNINLIKEKVDMVIAVTGEALIKAFNLENFNPETMLQIPYKGPLSNPKLDKKIATARFSALVAQKEGFEDSFIGKFIEVAAKNLIDPPVPNKTTDPLPWEKKDL